MNPQEGILEIESVSNGAIVETREHPTRPKPSGTALRYGFIPREKFDSINIGPGLTLERRFTTPGIDPFDTVEWERRTAIITDERGRVVFEQTDVEVPAFWSQLATNVVVSKYFRGQLGTPERETSVKQVVGRVVDTLTEWGRQMNYFATEADAEAFRDELKYLLIHQYGAFNSPVWFNVGIEPRSQCSACFIVSVEDTMESILELAKTEGMIFKFGSGSGSNLSRLRGSQEYLSGGGRASGPVSFMRGFDAFAGVIKSGGKTRRAAKMVILNIDHPDIVEFIECKAKEEKKAWALIEAGYDPGFNVPGGAYDSVYFQNANHSVRVTDEFMRAVEEDRAWHTIARTTGEVVETYRARDLFRKIAEAAWVCGDPGLQFHDTTNRWHTVKNSGEIEASNPCSEFVFLNDTSCNLASLNLMKFRLPNGEFDIDAFRAAVRIFITAQEIIVDNSAYPTEKIADNSHNFRPLGLGYANLGALLMSLGLPYDSDAGRAYAAAITALMHGEAYRQSALIARDCGGPFPAFELNREPMLEVMRMHADALNGIQAQYVPSQLLETAGDVWHETLQLGENYGYRNAQVTVLAPTGTIAFLMDCDTTGIEPDIALVKYKTLVGGGLLKIVNTTVPLALQRLGYSSEEIEAITRYIDENDTIEGAPYLKLEHLPVFDCAFRPAKGVRSLEPMAHVKMMAAVQPFLSGAISKTVNVPNDATPEDIEQIYLEAWKLGLKAIAIYRDGSKRTQPLSTKKPEEHAQAEGERLVRRRLPDERRSITHKFSVAGHEGYITVGMYEDGAPGEIFLTMAKEGSVISGLMDAFATAISLALQYGVPLEKLVEKFSYTRFQPSGFTNNPQIPVATSIVDYIFRWLALKFLQGQPAPTESLHENSVGTTPEPLTGVQGGTGATDFPQGQGAKTTDWSKLVRLQQDAPPCPNCGMIMVRSGACYQCYNCGMSFGCG
ncbi:MAG: ribonucleoside-diphosphate reductase, adenosylcobalamin-dependent [Armatimonadetes bacterium CP1_7O]|nr:MAG: ribonucleoside-diphosphate reductase, adenosylcobalamin-dependent [Armatimonadetes bacterium CP1_7O]